MTGRTSGYCGIGWSFEVQSIISTQNESYHPRFSYCTILIPRVDAESRPKDALLDPANKQLWIGFGTPKTAHIVTVTSRHGTQCRTHAHGHVVFDSFPLGVIVTAPRLADELVAERHSRSCDEERSLIR